ncbi:hypothetical protein Tco_0010510 [Tanacetum coccineum]
MSQGMRIIIIMATGSKERPPMLGPGKIFTMEITESMWIAIERLQQGESLNVQDVKTNLFWEFRKLTSRDGESMESYYSRFYKLMNELTRNKLEVTTMLVNQYQNEVNDIRAERIAKSANPLALLTAAQPYLDNYYQAPKPQRSNATSSSTRPSASTRHKGKEIAKLVQNERLKIYVSNERQHSENNTAECADERAALANLIANLTLDTEENKTILKQLKKANTSLTQELEECKTNLKN